MSECAVCGTAENLHSHHIDGDEHNDNPDNRVTLCSSHHKQVHGDSKLDRIKDEKVLELKEELPETERSPVECRNCGYSWETEGLRENVTCPSCQKKTEIDHD